VISDRLDEFLDGNRNQVVITTHGVEFLRTATDTFNLLLVKKDRNGPTLARSINARTFLDLLINNNQNELFFADKVILCEGLDEHVLRAAADELFPGELDSHNVSIVSVEGKDRLIKVASVILDLGIACYILCDFDFLLRDPMVIPGASARPHKSVEHLPDAFFNQPHVALAKPRVTKSNVAKLRNKIREKYPEEFYAAKHVSDINHEKLPGFLNVFRNAGIGILDGEIEHLSKDATWISPESKLDLSKVYELRERLSAGHLPSSILELDTLRQLLATVLAKSESSD
jgi:hypothetical protein